MSEPLTTEYVLRRTDQLNAAAAEGDGDLVVGVIRQIRADGHDEFAEMLVNALVQNLVAAARS